VPATSTVAFSTSPAPRPAAGHLAGRRPHTSATCSPSTRSGPGVCQDGEIVGTWVHPAVRSPPSGRRSIPRCRQGIGRLLVERCIAQAGPRGPAGAREPTPPHWAHAHRLPRGGAAPSWSRGRPPGGRRAMRAPARRHRGRSPVERDGRAFGAPARRASTSTCGAASPGRRARRHARRLRSAPGWALGYLLGLGRPRDPARAARHAGGGAQGERTALRTLVPASDRRLVDGLLGVGFRVSAPGPHGTRGGGTAPRRTTPS
jgi:hypothetical protein